MNPIEQLKKTVVARVNGVEINQFQLENALESVKEGMRTQGTRRDGKSSMDYGMRSFVLQKLIEREILFQEAKQLKITVKEEEMEKVLKKSLESFPSEDHFKASLVMSGITLDEYKRRLFYDVMVNKVAAQKVESLRKDTSWEEVKEYYERNKDRFTSAEMVKISLILIKCSPYAMEEEKKKALEKIQKIRDSKEDFGDLARQYSQAESASQGGYLGFVKRGQLHPFLEIAAFKTEVNQVSEVVKTENGFHLIKVHQKRNAGDVPKYEEVKEDLKRELDNQRGIAILADYVDQLKKKAKIVIVDKMLEGLTT
jgi:parvulin-like peptidyl-prolyl isomerase